MRLAGLTRAIACLLLGVSLAAGAAERAFRDCADCPEMVAIPAGSFVMGSPAGEAGRFDDEGPQRTVDIGAFALGRSHVTRAQYAAFAKATGRGDGDGCFVIAGTRYEKDPRRNWRDPGFAQTESDPVVCVSYIDAQAYIAWLNRRAGKDRYRLPTEAEFEYAARAGGAGLPWGARTQDACRYANVGDLTLQEKVADTAGWEVHACRDGYAFTSPAGRFPRNAFGLYDMIGNARQVLADCYRDSYAGAPRDGSPWTDPACEKRSARGGSFGSTPRYARYAKRFRFLPDDRYVNLGFRLARSP